MAHLRRRFTLSEEAIVAELVKMGFTRMTDVAQWDGDRVTLLDSAELDKFVSAGVMEVKQGRDGVSIKLADKKGALELLGRKLGMFKDKLEIHDDRLTEAMKRIGKEGKIGGRLILEHGKQNLHDN